MAMMIGAGEELLARPGLRTRLARLVASPRFQDWAVRIPFARGIARRDGQALFDLMQGFVASQVLLAVVDLRLLHHLMTGPAHASDLAPGAQMAPERMELLLQSAAALGLLRKGRDGRYVLSRQGAALIAVPGLERLIDHHRLFYRDMGDPVRLLRDDTETELAAFWPYVFGAARATDPDTAQAYSEVMAETQGLVAQDTLKAVRLAEVRHLLDLGGGSGVFAARVLQAVPGLRVTLMDLPPVIAQARARLASERFADRVALWPGSFRDDPLPDGADAVSLVRVLYDHADDTVRALLSKIHAALPPGGRLIVSEPMSGGATPDRAGDVYFAFYCLAMRTGRVRSPVRIVELLRHVGFVEIAAPKPFRPYVTSVVTARKARS